MSNNALVSFDSDMVKMRDQLSMVLPGHLPVDRMARTLRATLSANPRILQCNRNSLWRAVMSSALFGLEVDGRQSAIVPFGNQAQWIPMVNGLVTIAWNNGFVVQGEVVRAKDEFRVTLGTHRDLVHHPATGAPHDRDNPIVGAYAIASHRSMPTVFEHMDLPDILRVRDGSKGYQYARRNNKASQWIDDFRGMARKTPIRALCNHLPWNVQRAVEIEDEYDKGRTAWATRDGSEPITVQYASVDDEDVADTHRPATRQLDARGDLVDEDAYKARMEAEGAAVEASRAQGRIE
mgnify:CR=1 FL=1